MRAASGTVAGACLGVEPREVLLQVHLVPSHAEQARLARGQVVAGHLSRQNNRPELACAALAPVLGCAPADVQVAGQGEGCDWVVV
jgi:hypothetical protein